ncbi:MAG TPA: WYL domain-containing protein [Gemmatimonadaceae bacterium]|jgi:predicted DNA-binding transcriptional regulator YafY|nr:WYL domain-containing protein [Gemmatimonadaceae bacterium]
MRRRQVDFETIIRDAGRQHRKVRIQFRGTPSTEYDREMEPYAIRDGHLVAYSLYRDEFRTLPLADITGVDVTSRTFIPRRRVDL